MNHLLCVVVAGMFCLSPLAAMAGEIEPAVAVKHEGPATKPSGVVVPADVRTLLDGVRDAYAKLKSLELTGTITARFDVAGQKETNVDSFSSSYQAPNLFRHEMKDDMLVGSTGEKIYAFQAAQNLFVLKDAPKDRVAVKDLPEPINQLIPIQNPSLALVLATDAGEQLIDGATAVKSGGEITLGGVAFQVFSVSTPVGEWTYQIDSKTHLLQRATLNQKAYLVKVGQNDVKEATIEFAYMKVASDSAMKDTQFAWTPPANARDMSSIASAKGGDEDPAAKLEGNAAPDFTLNDLAGKEVTLSGLKGNVVIVDFWATWCGPCVQSLPHLNKLYDEKKGDGLKVIAVSVDEDKAKVPPFVADKQLHFTVVTDSEQAKAAQKFLVQGIPQTVVIGKSGKVRKVFVGFGPGSEDKLRAEVEAAMKE